VRRKGGSAARVAISFRAHHAIFIGRAHVGIIGARAVRVGCRNWWCEGGLGCSQVAGRRGSWVVRAVVLVG